MREYPAMESDEIKSLLPAVREESRDDYGATAGRRSSGAARPLAQPQERRQLQKLVITSAVSGEGKTLMAMEPGSLPRKKHEKKRGRSGR